MFTCPYEDYFRMLRVQYSITIKPEERRLYLIRDKKIFKSYPIAVGKPSSPTPKGTFKIENAAINPGGPFGVGWLGLDAPYGDYGIHGHQ